MRWLVLGVIGFILYKLISNEIQKKAEKNAAQKGAAAGKNKDASETMAKDPICGSYVPLGDSVSVKDGKTVYRFCSYECRDAFLQQLRSEGREIPEKNSSHEE